MSADTEIAKAFVTFTERGLDEYKRGADEVIAKTDKLVKSQEKAEKAGEKTGKVIGKQMKDAGRLVDQFQQKMDRLSQRIRSSGIYDLAKVFAFGGGLGMGGIFAAASSGTVEMERLGEATQKLMDKLGAGFAPIVRGATEVIKQLTKEWDGLTQAEKDSYFQIGLWTTGLAGMVVGIPVAINWITKLGTALATAGAAGGWLLGGGGIIGGGAAGGMAGKAGLLGPLAAGGIVGGGAAMAIEHTNVGQSFGGFFDKYIGRPGAAAINWAASPFTDYRFNWDGMNKGNRAAAQAARAGRANPAADGDVSHMLPPPGWGAKPGMVTPAMEKEMNKLKFAGPKGFEGLAAAGLLGRVKDAFNKGAENKAPFARGQVQFEGIGDVFYRIMKAGQGDAVDIAKLQLDKQRDMVNELQRANAALGQLANSPAGFARR